jgi:hypothetical protein
MGCALLLSSFLTTTGPAQAGDDIEPTSTEGPAVEAESSEGPSAGWADDADKTTAPELPGPPARVGPKYDEAYVAGVNRSAERVSIGYSVGLWGRGVGEDFRVSVPLGKKKKLGLRFRFIWAHGTFTQKEVDDMGRKLAGYDPVVMPSVEFFYRSPVLKGIVRLYGGGGFWVGFRPFAPDVDDPATKLREDAVMNSIPFVGGGHYGMEIFAKPDKAFFIEIGGQGPAHALWVDAGASILAGSVWYVGRGRQGH